MIRWFANNSIAANFLMIGILVAGAYAAVFHVPLEVTPTLSWDTVMIEMPYRGATAKDVERAILIPVEEALEDVKGIEQLNADGMRGNARFYLRAKAGVDLRGLMDDVKARIDTITTFPNETERPRVFIPDSGSVFEVLSVAVTGNLNPHDLRNVASPCPRRFAGDAGHQSLCFGRRPTLAKYRWRPTLTNSRPTTLAFKILPKRFVDSRSTCRQGPSTVKAARLSFAHEVKPIRRTTFAKIPIRAASEPRFV